MTNYLLVAEMAAPFLVHLEQFYNYNKLSEFYPIILIFHEIAKAFLYNLRKLLVPGKVIVCCVSVMEVNKHGSAWNYSFQFAARGVICTMNLLTRLWAFWFSSCLAFRLESVEADVEMKRWLVLTVMNYVL
jgi:hypothetical protein